MAAPHAPGHALLAATALTSAANAQLSGVSTAGYTAGYTAKSRNNGAFPPLVPERVVITFSKKFNCLGWLNYPNPPFDTQNIVAVVAKPSDAEAQASKAEAA